MVPALLWIALSVSPEAAREAKELSRHSMIAYDAGKFERAIADATRGFELDPLPAFLFNVAQCHRALHHWEKAEFFYRRYLAHVPEAQNRQTVEALIAAVQIRQGKSPESGAPVLPGIESSVASGSAAPAKAEGEQATAKAAPGLLQDVEVYPPVVVVRDDLELESPRPLRSWAWGTAYLAAGLAVAGAVLGVANVVATNNVSGTPRPITAAQEPQLSSQLGLAQGLGIAADALFIGAGASAVSSLVLFLVSRRSDAAPALSVGPAPAGLGLGASGSF
jgi:hypothetical protein